MHYTPPPPVNVVYDQLWTKLGYVRGPGGTEQDIPNPDLFLTDPRSTLTLPALSLLSDRSDRASVIVRRISLFYEVTWLDL